MKGNPLFNILLLDMAPPPLSTHHGQLRERLREKDSPPGDCISPLDPKGEGQQSLGGEGVGGAN
jgi:hypothetical protein